MKQIRKFFDETPKKFQKLLGFLLTSKAYINDEHLNPMYLVKRKK